jgi:hypothetical protein
MRTYNVVPQSDLPAQRYAAAQSNYHNTARLYAAARCSRAEWLVALLVYREAQFALSRATIVQPGCNAA